MCVAPNSPASSKQHGFGRAALLIVIVLLALAGVVVMRVLKQSHADDRVQAAQNIANPVAALPADADEATDSLLTRARAEVAVHHLLAPAGGNAFELYLRVRQREPANPAADEALREIFPFAAEQAAATIRAGELSEARRQLALLVRADPGNYTVTLLRQQLDARAGAASQPVRANAAGERPPARRMPVAPGSSAVSPAAAPSALSSPPAPNASVASASTPQPLATAPAVEATLPKLLHRSAPYYPRDARRTRRQGWVDVQFTVSATGEVVHAEVINAEPKNLFDHAAITAVERWTFAPGTRDGQPVAMRMHQRLDFRL